MLPEAILATKQQFKCVDDDKLRDLEVKMKGIDKLARFLEVCRGWKAWHVRREIWGTWETL